MLWKLAGGFVKTYQSQRTDLWSTVSLHSRFSSFHLFRSVLLQSAGSGIWHIHWEENWLKFDQVIGHKLIIKYIPECPGVRKPATDQTQTMKYFNTNKINLSFNFPSMKIDTSETIWQSIWPQFNACDKLLYKNNIATDNVCMILIDKIESI